MVAQLHTSVDGAAAANEDTRVKEYNGHFETASGALTRINATAKDDLHAATARMKQVAEVLGHVEIHGTTAAAQENYRQGNPLSLGSTAGAPALMASSEDSAAINALKAMFGPDLNAVVTWTTPLIKGLQHAAKRSKEEADNIEDGLRQMAAGNITVGPGGVPTAQAQIADLTEKLRLEIEAHDQTKKTVNASDPALTQELNRLKAANSDLGTKLAAEQAKKTPAVVTGADVQKAVDLVGRLHGHVEHKRSVRDPAWIIPNGVLSRSDRDLLGATLLGG